MKYETKFRLLISYLVASQMFAQQPVIAQDGAATLNGFMEALAQKNGVMYVNSSAPSRSGPAVVPTKDELRDALRNLPAPISYAHGMPTPDPTPAEALTLIPPITDVQPVEINGKMIYPIFGTVTQADETLTGIFEDLSTLDLSSFEPQPDPGMFDPDTDAEGNQILPPLTTYDILEPVLTPDERALTARTLDLTTSVGMLERKVALDAKEMSLQLSNSAVDFSEVNDDSDNLAYAAFAGNSTSVTAADLAAAISHADTKDGVILKGYVETNVDCSSFIHVRRAVQSVPMKSGHQLAARKGSLLWLEQDDETKLCVKSASFGIRVTLNNGVRVDLAPGEELVWVHDPREAAATLKDGVARRKVARHELPDGSCVIVSEFSLLHHLSKQNDSNVLPYREQILKTIAALNLTCRHHGRYQIAKTG